MEEVKEGELTVEVEPPKKNLVGRPRVKLDPRQKFDVLRAMRYVLKHPDGKYDASIHKVCRELLLKDQRRFLDQLNTLQKAEKADKERRMDRKLELAKLEEEKRSGKLGGEVIKDEGVLGAVKLVEERIRSRYWEGVSDEG